MSRKKRPSKALLEDLKKVLDKHNWPSPVSVAESAASAFASDANPCPEGQTMQPVDIQLEDGSVVTVKKCL